MRVSERSLFSQCVFTLQICLLAIISLWLLADYLHQAAYTPQVTTSEVTVDSSTGKVLLPASDYQGHHNGDVLLTYSGNQ